MRDLIDHLEGKVGERPEAIAGMMVKSDPSYKPSLKEDGSVDLRGIKGIA